MKAKEVLTKGLNNGLVQYIEEFQLNSPRQRALLLYNSSLARTRIVQYMYPLVDETSYGVEYQRTEVQEPIEYRLIRIPITGTADLKGITGGFSRQSAGGKGRYIWVNDTDPRISFEVDTFRDQTYLTINSTTQRATTAKSSIHISDEQCFLEAVKHANRIFDYLKDSGSLI
jgi:hypothetical protein